MEKYINQLSEKKFSFQKWNKSLELSQKIIKELDIKSFVYIKDFKNVKNYFGSNVDIYIWDQNEVKVIVKHLEKIWFKKPRIDFEYDKFMMVPPWYWENNHKLLSIHIYPYLWWYTLRLNIFKKMLSEIPYDLREWFKVFPIEYEVPLILFHWYMEDRKISDYDIKHLNYIRENSGYKVENSLNILTEEFKDMFIYIYELYLENINEDEIVFLDSKKHLSFSLKVKSNKIHNKLYYLLIHTAKWLKIIRW